MKRSKISCLALLVSLLSINIGCKNTSSSEVIGPYGNKIEEDLNSLNIIEDNYRNYYEIFVYRFRIQWNLVNANSSFSFISQI